MNKPLRQVGYFLSGQHFSNGVRITGSILLPSLLGAQVGQLPTGMVLSLGALSVSISDAPGPLLHRRNAMLVTVLISGLVTFVTGFARLNPFGLSVEIGLFSFFFSMFAVWGNRAASVGTAALLVMILMLDRPLDAAGVLRESGLIVAGGFWYTAVSLLASRLQPYRPAQQALGQCIHEIARLMAIKADFYTTSTDLDDDYRRLLAQQVVVNEQQNAVREILFKSRQFVTESTRTGRLLVLTFVDTVDLYEQVLALYYDYATIRERFGHSDVLNRIADLIRRLSVELDRIGLAVQSPVRLPQPLDVTESLDHVKRGIDALGDRAGSTLVLRKVLVSLRNVTQRIATIRQSLSPAGLDPANPAGADSAQRNPPEYGRFVSHQEIDLKSFRENLALESSVFRHSVRVAVAMLVGFVLTQLLPYGQYSYWVLLTISVILKPAFSLTKQRNTERILGTLGGGLIGLLILTFVADKTAQFGLMVLLMLGTYSTQRTNYIAMVVCVTPFLLIVFNFLGQNYLGAAGERLFDTLLGGTIALLAGYLLFPRWESEQLTEPMRDVLDANRRYVQLLYDSLSGQRIRVTDYKLVRKDVYVTSANLEAAFERMLSEPKRKQRNVKLLSEFVVLNHILSANVAAITSARLTGEPTAYLPPLLRPVKRALFALTESLRRLGGAPETPVSEPAAPDSNGPVQPPDDPLLTEQFGFIQQVSSDIHKLTERIYA